jgi:hypothetical protein
LKGVYLSVCSSRAHKIVLFFYFLATEYSIALSKFNDRLRASSVFLHPATGALLVSASGGVTWQKMES